VTFRFSPSDVYPEGHRLEGETEAGGDLVFRPVYEERVLVDVPLDQARWSGLTGVLEAAFDPTGPTRDCYLRVTVQAGDRPLVVHWSWVRPPGGLPLWSADDPGAPAGGLVLNALYAEEVPLLSLLGDLARGYVRLFWLDPWLSGAYVVVCAGALGWVVWRPRGDGSRGR
jgi:hypothetical protein